MENPAAIFLQTLMQKALAAVKPELLVKRHLQDIGAGQVTIVGLGKAAAQMAIGVEHILGETVQGVVVVPDGYEADCKWIKVLNAAHPVPDQRSIRAAKQLINEVKQSNSQVLALVSGGGSSLACYPAPFISFTEKQDIIKQMLSAGVSIGDLNLVRGTLSLIKYGGLASNLGQVKTTALVLSDIAGDDLDLVASGPFSSKRPNGLEALKILDQVQVPISNHLRDSLKALRARPKNLAKIDKILIGNASTALIAARKWAESQGVVTRIISDELEGSAEELVQLHLRQIAKAKADNIQLLLSGGEVSVNVTASGRGGPNRHFLLSLAIANPQLTALAIDTDGKDGCDDEAGAWVGPDALDRAYKLGLDPKTALDQCDSGAFFKAIGTSIHTGPTRTNVNDFRAIWLGS